MTRERGVTRRRIALAAFGAALAVVVAVPIALGAGRARTGTFALEAKLEWQGGDAPCPAGTPAMLDCHPHPGGPSPVRGLGAVSQTYLYPVEGNPAGCLDGYHVAGYPATLAVKGKGEIRLAVDGLGDCLAGPPADTVVSNTQRFTVTGGSGPYAGASGEGTVQHIAHRLVSGHAAGTDVWKGALVVPGLEFDLAPPRISGAVDRTVRARRGIKRLEVTYKVAAVDDVDGAMPASCKPRAGSQFKLGRTLVSCSATDRSANTATAKFTITVKAGR